MKIEHIAMYVNELESARDFFVKYLGGMSNDGYHNKTTGFRSFFISFDDGARFRHTFAVTRINKLSVITCKHVLLRVLLSGDCKQ